MSDERIIPKIDLGLYEEAHAEICKRCRLRFAHLEVELVWARAWRPEPNFRLWIKQAWGARLDATYFKKAQRTLELWSFLLKSLGFKVILKAYLGSTLRVWSWLILGLVWALLGLEQMACSIATLARAWWAKGGWPQAKLVASGEKPLVSHKFGKTQLLGTNQLLEIFSSSDKSLKEEKLRGMICFGPRHSLRDVRYMKYCAL